MPHHTHTHRNGLRGFFFCFLSLSHFFFLSKLIQLILLFRCSLDYNYYWNEFIWRLFAIYRLLCQFFHLFYLINSLSFDFELILGYLLSSFGLFFFFLLLQTLSYFTKFLNFFFLCINFFSTKLQLIVPSLVFFFLLHFEIYLYSLCFLFIFCLLLFLNFVFLISFLDKHSRTMFEHRL